MLKNREFTDIEKERFGAFGRIRDSSSVPASKRTGVVLVHGRAGNETLMWVFSRVIEALDPIVIAPRALEVDPIGGYSWWNFPHRPDHTESPAPRETTLSHLQPGCKVLSNIVSAMPEYGVLPGNIIGIGFSQGSALIGSFILEEPQAFSKVALLAGFLPVSVQEEYLGSRLKLPSIFMSHGTQDEVIPIDKAEATAEFYKSLHADVTFTTDDVGHKIGSGGMRALKAWLGQS